MPEIRSGASNTAGYGLKKLRRPLAVSSTITLRPQRLCQILPRDDFIFHNQNTHGLPPSGNRYDPKRNAPLISVKA
jgi:hypothetical protein